MNKQTTKSSPIAAMLYMLILLITTGILMLANTVQGYPIDENGKLLVTHGCSLKANYAEFVVQNKDQFELDSVLTIAEEVYKKNKKIMHMATYVDMQRIARSLYRWEEDFKEVPPEKVKEFVIIQCTLEGF